MIPFLGWPSFVLGAFGLDCLFTCIAPPLPLEHAVEAGVTGVWEFLVIPYIRRYTTASARLTWNVVRVVTLEYCWHVVTLPFPVEALRTETTFDALGHC